jgi:hypothetical protein
LLCAKHAAVITSAVCRGGRKRKITCDDGQSNGAERSIVREFTSVAKSGKFMNVMKRFPFDLKV